MAGEPLTPPTLPQARAGDPITAAGWNALVRAVGELQAIFQRLETQQPTAVLVTVRDALAGRLAAAAEVGLVYAIAETSGLPTPPAERRGDGYRLANLAPGRYQVVVETTPQSGQAGRTQSGVTLSQGQTAVVQMELFPAGVAASVPSLFGQTLQNATALLVSLGLVAGQVVDAHGQAIDTQDLRRFANRRVVSSEPGVDMPVAPGADGQRRVNLLVAGQVEAVERVPRLVAQVSVTRPARIVVAPDGAKAYALSLGSSSGEGAGIAVMDTHARQLTQIVPLTLSGGSTTPLDVVFHPNPTVRQAFLLAVGTRSLSGLGSVSLDRLSLLQEAPIDAAPAAGGPQLAGPEGLITAGSALLRSSLVAQRTVATGVVAAVDTQRDRVAPGGVINFALGSDLGIDAAGRRLFVAVPAQHALLAFDVQDFSTITVAPDVFKDRSPSFIATLGSEVFVADAGSPAIISVPQSLNRDQVRVIDLSSTQATAALDLVAANVGPAQAQRRVVYVVARRGGKSVLTAAFLESFQIVEADLTTGAVQILPDVEPLVITQPQTVFCGLAITPDGGRLCVGVDGAVAVVDTAARRVIASVPLEGQPAGLAITPDGRQLYVANLEGDLLQIVDLTGTEDAYQPPVVRPRPPIGGIVGRLGTVESLGGLWPVVPASPAPDSPVAFGRRRAPPESWGARP